MELEGSGIDEENLVFMGGKMTPKEFAKFAYKKANGEFDNDLMPPPTSAKDGLEILIKHFLGDDWYYVLPVHATQIYTEAIYEILLKYPKKVSLMGRAKNAIQRKE